MKRLTKIGILLALTLVLMCSGATMASTVLYSEDFSAATSGLDSLNAVSWNSAGWVPHAWAASGRYYPGSGWYWLDPPRFDLFSGLHPGWGTGAYGDYSGGYYGGIFRTGGTVADYWKVFDSGLQSTGKLDMTVKVSPVTSNRVPDEQAADYGYIGLGNTANGYQLMGVAYWYFDNPTNMVEGGTVGWILKFPGGQSARIVTPFDESTILTISLDLDNLTASGSILAGANTYPTSVYPITSGATVDNVIAEQYKFNRYSFDFTDVNVSLTGSLSGSIDAQVQLSDFNLSADLSLAPVRIEVIKPSDGSVFYTHDYTLTTNPQTFNIPGIPVGSYNVRFSANKWLQKVATGVVVPSGGVGTADGTMLNGDVDGDGTVTTTDVSIPIKNL